MVRATADSPLEEKNSQQTTGNQGKYRWHLQPSNQTMTPKRWAERVQKSGAISAPQEQLEECAMEGWISALQTPLVLIEN
tara:strand:+ start:533 stop:772 length:240 start_codon:yes stop_codon:yes gene_type:complete